jgi:hypothetical protein
MKHEIKLKRDIDPEWLKLKSFDQLFYRSLQNMSKAQGRAIEHKEYKNGPMTSAFVTDIKEIKYYCKGIE